MANGPHSPLPALMVALTIAACERTPAHQPVRGFPPDAIAALAQRESVLTSTPDTARLRAYMLAMTEEPHHAGSPGAKAVAEYALARFREWGLDAQIEEFEALLPMPVLRRVELVSPTRFVARMNEPAIPEDKDSGDEGMLPTSTPYAADGDVTGDLVFANYGLPEDYALLDERKIDLRGKVVIVKYSRGVRSAKIKQAAERGAVAVLIYSDPKEDGFARGDVYPKGPWRPADGVQRGTALDYAAMYPGDPLTPGWGAKAGARTLPRSEARSLPKIPVAPLSYGDAGPLLAALDGPASPNDRERSTCRTRSGRVRPASASRQNPTGRCAPSITSSAASRALSIPTSGWSSPITTTAGCTAPTILSPEPWPSWRLHVRSPSC